MTVLVGSVGAAVSLKSFARRALGEQAVAVQELTSAAGSPIIDADFLVERVRADFGVSLGSISQVFGGQDSDAVLIRAATVEDTELAVKVSRSQGVSGLLACAQLARGIPSGIAGPLVAHSGDPYSFVDDRRLSLTPWISGRPAFGAGMDADQWRRFGALLSKVHAAQLPPAVADQLPTEDYRSPATAIAADLHERIRESAGRGTGSADPLSAALVRDWSGAGDGIGLILAHIDNLGDELRTGSAPAVICHGDAHIGNVLLGENGHVWLLDWEEVVRAPRERDLMFVIGGVLTKAPVIAEEQQWFFEGYGGAEIDPIQLAYYRCSWAVQDLTDFAARILDRSAGPSSVRGQALALFRDLLRPTGIVQRALDSLRAIGRGLSE